MDAPTRLSIDRPLDCVFRLEALEVDPRSGLVTGPGGRETLDPKVMDVLVFMMRHAGEVVSRDELLAQLWPNSVVTEDAVTRCFYVLRTQLSQAGGDPRYRTLFETLRKRGYRFNGEIGSLLPVAPYPARDAEFHRPWAIAFVIFAAIAILAVAI